MILAIDVGNTNLVLALGDRSGSVDSVWRVSSDAVVSAAACADEIRAKLGQRLAEVGDTVIASVVPTITPHVAAAMHEMTGRAPLVVGGAGVDLGIAVNIDHPEQAGADRVVNAVGAQVHHRLPAVILDFGTATTLDLVGADGAYEGGIIAPGVALSIEALKRAAAQLPRLELRAFDDDLPVLGKYRRCNGIRDLLGLCKHDRRAAGTAAVRAGACRRRYAGNRHRRAGTAVRPSSGWNGHG